MIVREPGKAHDPRAGELRAIVHDLSRRAVSLATDDDLYSAVASSLNRLLEIDRLSILMTRDGDERLIPVYARSARNDDPVTNVQPNPFATPERSARDAVVLDLPDAGPEDGNGRRTHRQLIVSPLVIEDRQVGSIEIASEGANRFTANDLWIVETISDVLGLALGARIFKKQARDRARDEALIGGLTELIRKELEPARVLSHLAERIGTAIDCDVLIVRFVAGTWTAEEPFVRDAALRRARSTLVKRMESISPPSQHPPQRDAVPSRGSNNEIHELNRLAANIGDLLESEDIDGSLIVPFDTGIGGSLILVALRATRGDSAFSDNERARIERALRFMTPALVNAILHDDLARALGERDAVLRMSSAIGAGKDISDRIRIACRTAQLLYSCDYVTLTDWSTQPPNLRFVVGSTSTEPLILSKAGTITAVRRSGDVRIINDFPSVPPSKVAWYPLHVAEGLRASLTYRLHWSGKTFGSLILGFRKPRYFSQSDLRFAESIAHAVVASLGPELHLEKRQ